MSASGSWLVITPSYVQPKNGQESGQICPLNKSSKSLKGGVIGRGVTKNVLNVWTKTMHRCAEVTGALNIVSFLSNSQMILKKY